MCEIYRFSSFYFIEDHGGQDPSPAREGAVPAEVRCCHRISGSVCGGAGKGKLALCVYIKILVILYMLHQLMRNSNCKGYSMSNYEMLK